MGELEVEVSHYKEARAGRRGLGAERRVDTGQPLREMGYDTGVEGRNQPESSFVVQVPLTPALTWSSVLASLFSAE